MPSGRLGKVLSLQRQLRKQKTGSSAVGLSISYTKSPSLSGSGMNISYFFFFPLLPSFLHENHGVSWTIFFLLDGLWVTSSWSEINSSSLKIRTRMFTEQRKSPSCHVSDVPPWHSWCRSVCLKLFHTKKEKKKNLTNHWVGEGKGQELWMRQGGVKRWELAD